MVSLALAPSLEPVRQKKVFFSKLSRQSGNFTLGVGMVWVEGLGGGEEERGGVVHLRPSAASHRPQTWRSDLRKVRGTACWFSTCRPIDGRGFCLPPSLAHILRGLGIRNRRGSERGCTKQKFSTKQTRSRRLMITFIPAVCLEAQNGGDLA